MYHCDHLNFGHTFCIAKNMHIHATENDQVTAIFFDESIPSRVMTLPKPTTRATNVDIFKVDEYCLRVYPATPSGMAESFEPIDFMPGGRGLKHRAYSEMSVLVNDLPRLKGINLPIGIIHLPTADGNSVVGTIHEWCDTDFHTLIKYDKLSDAEVYEILVTVAETLERLHASGWAHTDVKPYNILVNLSEDGPEAIVADVDSIHRIGCLGGGNGTGCYMSPEMMSNHAIFPESDWWAFANMIHEAFLGEDVMSCAAVKSTNDDVHEYLEIIAAAVDALTTSHTDDDFAKEVKSVVLEIITKRPASILDILSRLCPIEN